MLSARRVVSGALAAGLIASAASAAPPLPGRLNRKIADAARTLGELTSMRDAEIPKDLLEDARCIAVLPEVTKGAIGVGGRFGRGLVSCRLEDGGWSTPGFVELGGGSFGFQIGAQVTDLLLVVRNKAGMDFLLRDKFTMGADAAVAAGPWGRQGAAATDLQFRAAILSWSRSRGVFAGLSLDGAVLKQDKPDNARLYGHPVTARALLLPDKGAEVAPPAATQPWMDALAASAPSKPAQP